MSPHWRLIWTRGRLMESQWRPPECSIRTHHHYHHSDWYPWQQKQQNKNCDIRNQWSVSIPIRNQWSVSIPNALCGRVPGPDRWPPQFRPSHDFEKSVLKDNLKRQVNAKEHDSKFSKWQWYTSKFPQYTSSKFSLCVVHSWNQGNVLPMLLLFVCAVYAGICVGQWSCYFMFTYWFPHWM